MDLMGASIVPVYEIKGNQQDFAKKRGINLLSVIEKMYGKLLIDCTVESIETKVGNGVQNRFLC